MAFEPRVLDPEPVADLEEYVGRGGGRGLDAARRLGPVGVLDELEASGLRGRGGAGFPTGRKWRTVVENLSPTMPATVVVNAAEGEPGTFKDRAIVRANPYRVMEGALVAAATVGADGVIVALKASFHQEIARIRAAMDEMRRAGWSEGVEMFVVEGPGEYLFGEETALLEVVAGREPFPRIAPPFRHGVDEAGPAVASAAGVAMAGPESELTPPTLVNNAETFANVANLLAEGPDWFRAVGTEQSTGTIVCTVTGRIRRHGVAEFPMGTSLGEVVDTVGGGTASGHEVMAVMSGVATPLVPGSALDTPVSYEGMEEIGSGLGTGGFIVFDDTTDPAAVAQGVSHFLAVESCGQCTPCKQDGLALAELLERLRRSEPEAGLVASIQDRVSTVSERARCYLAHQHQRVVDSILRLFPDELEAHATGRRGAGRRE
ncbi:MAG: SLBB domain-containing protein, partial [Actinomycetota bacterium]|nr:SLBB domain-containing protein [Actinomycetota bacterium]